MNHDLVEGGANVTGNLYFNGFDFRSFDLWLNTDKFLVLNEASRTVTSNVYGNLILSTKPIAKSTFNTVIDTIEPLHFYGTMNSPSLEGKLYISESNLTFPETKQESQNGGYDVIYDLDESQTINKHNKNMRSNGHPVIPISNQDVLFTGGLTDRIQYKLHIVTAGDLRVAMDFGLTEKLEDVLLSGNLYFTRDALGTTSLTGQLNINGWTYSFFDQFQIDEGSSCNLSTASKIRVLILPLEPPRAYIIQNPKRQNTFKLKLKLPEPVWYLIWI